MERPFRYMRLKEVLREPLLHFLLIGALAFAYSLWSEELTDAKASRIVVSSGQIEHLAAGFNKAWRRPPTEDELKGLIDDWVKEEIAVRAAREAGLDRGDTVIRRRLRQRLEYMMEDLADATAPSEEQLRGWFEEKRESYRSEPRLGFRQVFISREERVETAERDAAAMLERLRSAGASRAEEPRGDPTILPHELPALPLGNIDRIFGEGFAARLKDAERGAWSGPISSVYGLHLVFVDTYIEGQVAEFAAVRDVVERDYMLARRTRNLAEMYDQLLAKYTVAIESSTEPRPETGR